MAVDLRSNRSSLSEDDLKTVVEKTPDLLKKAEEVVEDICKNFEAAALSGDIVQLIKYHPNVIGSRILLTDGSPAELLPRISEPSYAVSRESRTVKRTLEDGLNSNVILPKYRNSKRVKFI